MLKDIVEKSNAHFNLKLVNLYINNGREYFSIDMREYGSSERIENEYQNFIVAEILV